MAGGVGSRYAAFQGAFELLELSSFRKDFRHGLIGGLLSAGLDYGVRYLKDPGQNCGSHEADDYEYYDRCDETLF